MSKIVPSQVVNFIARIPEHDAPHCRFNQVGHANLATVITLCGQLPAEVLTLDNDSFAVFLHAQEQIKEVLNLWDANTHAGQKQLTVDFPKFRNPLVTIKECLSRCSDEVPAPATAELQFIANDDLRRNFREDVGRVNSSLANGEWKASTVLAGSTIEALLFLDLQKCEDDEVRAAAQRAVVSKKLEQPAPSDIDKWSLPQILEASVELNRITPDTAVIGRLTKKYRNLIHPAASLRFGIVCDRGTALIAVAALEHVIRDLTKVST